MEKIVKVLVIAIIVTVISGFAVKAVIGDSSSMSTDKLLRDKFGENSNTRMVGDASTDDETPTRISTEQESSNDDTNTTTETTEITTEVTTEAETEDSTEELTTEVEETSEDEDIDISGEDILNIEDKDDSYIVTITSLFNGRNAIAYYNMPKEVKFSEIEFPSEGDKYADLSIPSVNITSETHFGMTQSNVDTWDSVISSKAGYCGKGTPIVIGGHRTNSFVALKDCKVGNYIFMQTSYGGYLYQIEKVSEGVVSDDNKNILNSEGKELLKFSGKKEKVYIYTCKDDPETGKQRYVVRAKLIQGTNIIKEEE